MNTGLPAPGVRLTRQKTAILQVLHEVTDFRSAQQLHDALAQRGQRIGLTTVYRILQSLVEAEQVDVLRVEGETLYRQCSMGHHHHLVCRRCGHTVEVAGPAVETWAQRVATEHGFREINHTLEVFGLCSGCG